MKKIGMIVSIIFFLAALYLLAYVGAIPAVAQGESYWMGAQSLDAAPIILRHTYGWYSLQSGDKQLTVTEYGSQEMMGYVWNYGNVWMGGNYNVEVKPIQASTDAIHIGGSFGWYDYFSDNWVCLMGANSDDDMNEACDVIAAAESITFDRRARVGLTSWWGDTNCDPYCNWEFVMEWGHDSIATIYGIYPIYWGVYIPPTPTGIPSLTPTATPLPCALADTGQEAEGNPVENFLVMGMGDTELEFQFTGDGAIVFADETIYCEADTPCDMKAESRTVGESFWCYFTGTICDNATYKSRPLYCPGEYELPEFEAAGVEGSGIVFSSAGSTCLDVDIFAFDLSDFPLLSIIYDTFGLTVPEWGWTEGNWEVCLDKYEIESAEIGDFDLEPFITLALGALVLIIVGWLIRR